MKRVHLPGYAHVYLTVPLFAAATLACGWWMAGRPQGIPETDQIIFDHQLHTADFGLPCADCHVGIEEATSLTTSFAPAEAVCLDCHDREDNCTLCHTNVESRREVWLQPDEPVVSIDHAAHLALDEVGGECGACHTDVATSTALPLAEPGHAQCLSCHQHETDYAVANCSTCHVDFTDVPLTAIAEFDHAGDWMARHGSLAMSQGATCSQCHTQSSCSECHSLVAAAVPAVLFPDQVGRRVMHRGDFVTSHAIEAQADPSSCATCHGTSESFCTSCHDAWGVGTRSLVARSPHPGGWMVPGSADFHGPAARMDIVACASCHDQGSQSNCVTCHSSGRLGGNPHPAGWALEHDLSEVGENPVCRACHSGRTGGTLP